MMLRYLLWSILFLVIGFNRIYPMLPKVRAFQQGVSKGKHIHGVPAQKSLGNKLIKCSACASAGVAACSYAWLLYQSSQYEIERENRALIDFAIDQVLEKLDSSVMEKAHVKNERTAAHRFCNSFLLLASYQNSEAMRSCLDDDERMKHLTQIVAVAACWVAMHHNPDNSEIYDLLRNDPRVRGFVKTYCAECIKDTIFW